jgi:hypothetical protein
MSEEEYWMRRLLVSLKQHAINSVQMFKNWKETKRIDI